MPLPIPFERCYWVEERKLLAGCYPGHQDEGVAEGKLAGMVNACVETVINLMEPGEFNWSGTPFRPYEPRIVEIAKMLSLDVKCLRFPIRDMGITTAARMEDILDAIEAGMANGNAVYVHCWGGKGRTGTVIGCYLIRHGLATPDNFVEVIDKLRGPDNVKTGPSPENDEQIEFVREFCAND